MRIIKIFLFLILMACAVSGFGQEYELDTIFRAENVDTLPVSRFDRRSLDILVRNYAFFIPAEAQKKGIEGNVIVSFVVYKNGGYPSDIKVIQSPDTLGILDSAAIGVIKSLCCLEPAIKDGKPVNVRIEMPIEYHLRKDVYEENYEEYQSYSGQHRIYYVPYNASFAGRFYVSGHYGVFSLLNQDKTGILKKSEKDPYCHFVEISGGKNFRGDRRVGFSAGLGFRSMCYNIDEEEAFNLKSSGSEVYGDYSAPLTESFKKHHLWIETLTLPLGMNLRFNLREKNRLYPCEVSIYATGTMRVHSREKQVYKIDGVKQKSIFVDDFSLRRFGCDLSFEFIFDFGGFRYTVSPMTLFGDGITPKVYYHAITYSFKIGILR